jgi:vancomycin resistance protein VanJ
LKTVGCQGPIRAGAKAKGGRPHRAAAVVVWSSWLYAAAVLSLWGLLGLAADLWWPATLVMFGPRWVWALPLVVLFPALAVVRPWLLWLPLISLAVVIGPIMSFCVPWHTFLTQTTKFIGVRVLTCNTEGDFLDTEELAKLIAEADPDIVVLQEWSHHEEREVFGASGWHVRARSPFCIGSRYPIRAVAILGSNERGGTECVVRYDLQTPGGVLYFFNVHIASVREGLQEVLLDPFRGPAELCANTELRWRESDAASHWVGQVDGPMLLAGDFNLPCESAIYRRYWSQFSDAFSSAGMGWGYTKFTRWHGIRIDHILAGPGWRFRRCWVGRDVHSDHRPIIAEVEWLGVSD